MTVCYTILILQKQNTVGLNINASFIDRHATGTKISKNNNSLQLIVRMSMV